ALETRTARDEDAVPVVVAGVGAAIVARLVHAPEAHLAERTSVEVVEVHHQVGREAARLAVAILGAPRRGAHRLSLGRGERLEERAQLLEERLDLLGRDDALGL